MRYLSVNETAKKWDVPERTNKRKEQQKTLLLSEYNSREEQILEDILEFHVMFERIHPFQDGNVTQRHPQKAA